MKSAAFVVAALAAFLQAPLFRTSVDAVRVDALVVDGRRPVGGLTAGDFELMDSGVPQTLDSIALTDVPIRMMVTLDTSQSVSGSTLDQLKRGVEAAIAALQPADRVALITFSSNVRLLASWDADTDVVRRAVTDLRGAGGTSLWDATFAALTFRDETPTVRRLVLIFSDGADTASWLPRNAVLDKARRTDGVVYAVRIKDMSSPAARTLQGRSGVELSKNDRSVWIDTPFLDELTDITGGSAYTAADAGELRGAFAKILTEFRTRYLLTYTPRGVDRAGWHPIEVKLKTKKGKVSARRGYLR